MARTKQIATPNPPVALPQVLINSTKAINLIKEKILKVEFVQSDAQMCEYLSMKMQLVKALHNSIFCLEKTIELSITSQKDAQAMTTGLEAMKELDLIFCPVKDCPTHTDKTKNDSIMAESSSKINEANNPKQNNKEKIKRPNNDNVKDNPKSNKRAGQEDFKTPNKFAKKIIEIPIEHVVCTSNNKFAVLGDEEIMEVTPASTPKKSSRSVGDRVLLSALIAIISTTQVKTVE
ncbi:uncharacterized protein TNCV_3955581 [Trichonephila clavipes]|nr:uncharacterized protein TNCV_3955581 [Trichonephila clavipes]